MKKAFGLSKVHGDQKALDTAIVKATNHEQVLPKEKHVRTIFQSLAPSKPRSEVAYCIHALARRLGHAHNWTVALKTLIIIHRAMRELDNTVWVELANYSGQRGCMMNLSHFQDSSSPNAIDYSAWIRNYAFYLEERLRCFDIVSYDVGTYSLKNTQKLDTLVLLNQLPALQDLHFRLLDCKPTGVAGYNHLIQYALAVVAGESVKIYVAITVRVVDILDKYFEMQRDDAIKVLEIYKKSGSQAERLSEFFETCRSLDFGRGQKFINIKLPPASFMTTMEDYVKEAPNILMLEYNVNVNDKSAHATENEAPVGDLLTEANQESNAEESDPSAEKREAKSAPPVADLMGLYDLLTGASEFEENALALAIVPTDNSLTSSNDENLATPATGWEVALFTEPESSQENVVSENKEAGGLYISTLDSLYHEAMAGTEHNGSHQMVSNPFDISQGNLYNMDPQTGKKAFCAPLNMASPIPVQMVGMPYPDYMMMMMQQQQQQQQQHQQEAFKKSTNPFD